MIWIGIIFLCIIGYICLAVAPFARQPKVSDETMEQTQVSDYYGENTGSERAWVLPDSRDGLTERLRLIAGAKERIILSTFDMRSDESGKLLLAALLDAAERGVKVSVVLDGYSYMTQAWGNPYFLALARQEGVELRIYNYPNLLKPWKLMARMHDKYLIADTEVYILGGRNSNDLFLGEPNESQNYDWDVLVYQAGERGTVNSLMELEQYFQTIWESGECRLIGKAAFWRRNPAVERAVEELQTLYSQVQTQHSDWLEPVDYAAMTQETHQIRLVSNPIHTAAKEPVAYHVITELMAQPGERVWFHTPYILCSKDMQARLEWLCRQNPDITMMTNSIANNANPFGALDYRVHKEEILQTGLNILEYDSGVSYHGKCFTVGDRLAGIGSFNWDMRSAYIDTELMLIIDSEEVTKSLREAMRSYEKNAFQVIDGERYEPNEGTQMQDLTPQRERQLNLLSRLLGWVRFLM